MKSIQQLSIFLTFSISILFTSCEFKKETNGPYFGNGFHNGWADQHSIVIWTQLTNSAKKAETGWFAVDETKNFTHLWKLKNLEPDTKYVVEMEARQDSKSKVSDKIAGAFRTPPTSDAVDAIEFCVVTCHDYIRKDTTSYFMKDDHDVLTDDAFPGMTYGTVSWERGLEIFDKEQLPTADTTYKTVQIGRAHV